MKRIEAVFARDWVEPYAASGDGIPVVEASTHPRFTAGTRFDYGFIQVALRDGYDICIRQLLPNEKSSEVA